MVGASEVHVRPRWVESRTGLTRTPGSASRGLPRRSELVCFFILTPNGARRGGGGLLAEQTHLRRWIPLSSRDSFGCDSLDALQVILGKLDSGGGDVFLEVGDPLGSRYRHDLLALRQHPGDRQLAWAHPLLQGNLPHLLH